jgi:hypothetical protein
MLILSLTLFPVHYDRAVPFRLIIGNLVSAQEADYTCDGINDNVQFQEALDALPESGGMIYVLAGNYEFADGQTVTRDIDRVSVVGLGGATHFGGDNATPIFEAGGDKWLFSNLWTDGGGLAMGSTSDWCWLNVGIYTSLYAVLTDAGGVGGMEVHGNEWHTVVFATDGRVSTLNATLSGAVVNIANLQGNVTILNSTCATLNASIISLQSSLASVNATVVLLQSGLESLNTTVLTHTSQISTLNATTVTLNSSLVALNTSVGGLNTSYQAHIIAGYGVHNCSIGDVDGDTRIMCQNTTDDDYIRFVNNGTSTFNLTASGILTVGSQSYFRGYISADQSVPKETTTQVAINVETIDRQNEFNTATYNYTVTVPGLYLVVAVAIYYIMPSGVYQMGCYVLNNGVGVVRTEYYSANQANSSYGILAVGIVACQAGDVLSMYTWQGSTATQKLYGGADGRTNFIIAKVS